MAVWLVRDCGLFTYQVTANFGAGYYAPKTTEPLINYTACYQLAFIHFNQLAINFAVSRAFGQTHSLTSFGRAIGFSSDLAMCVAVKRRLYFS
ncbi:MAG TPA: hypothetical protein DDY13_12220 [Cytophagales bacterium]|nr:hypothetical protein [Cytophagales bacterium]